MELTYLYYTMYRARKLVRSFVINFGRLSSYTFNSVEKLVMVREWGNDFRTWAS